MSGASVSIVVEWDNVRLSELGRARRMLAAVAEQAALLPVRSPSWASAQERRFLQSIDSPLEVLVTYDSTEFGEDTLRGIVEHSLPPGQTAIRLRYVPVPGARYYQLKNAGAENGAGDVVVFLDSDAVPEPGWLEAILAPFAQPDRQVIGGNTYLATNSLYSRTFALVWFFPARSADGDPVPAPRFLANNVAFRRDLFLANPFPAEPGLSKGACIRLADRLTAAGITIFRAPRARCSHPAPNGLQHFVTRAIAEGRDRCLAPVGKAASLRESAERLYHHLRDSAYHIMRRRETVGMPLREVPAALGIAWTYFGLYFLGEAMSHALPGYMRRHFQL